ncbi:hypothetical protein SO694_00037297 [Aureococcus anophagefferens]|uniref:Cytochrome c domain-containing protein n=1 Tax=Aureococcus anophagefferens TaxID=44056 RepID=A0ABR1FL35_AURAN
MTPQEALEQVAPRGRAAPKLKNALREDAYEVFEAWASQSAAAAAEDLAAATARSNDAGREAAAIKAAMDKKKKKKSMAEADYAPVAAGERVQALAVLRAAGPDYDLPWASRCATCHALLALGERYAGEEFEFGAGPAAGMAGDVALGALAEAFLLEDALCLSNDVLLGEPTKALYPVPPPLLRCLAHADWRPFLPGDPRYAAIRSCAPKKLRRTLAQIDGLLRRKDAPPPLSPVAAVDAELRAHLDKVESWEDAFAKTVVRRDGAVVGGDQRAAEARGAAAKVSFERPLPDAADAAEPPPPPPPDDGYDRHAAAYDAPRRLKELSELSDAAKKKDGAADAAQPAEAEAPPPAKGAGWGAPASNCSTRWTTRSRTPRRTLEEAPPPPPATADVAPPPPPDAA